MPILRKDGQKLYFVHLPFSVRENFYVSLIEAGYEISNLGPRSGNFDDVKGSAFLGRFRKRTGITSLPVEGLLGAMLGKILISITKDKNESHGGKC